MARDTLATGTSRKYIKHPPAADALSQVKNGHPVDSGTWHIIVNNTHVLQAESARQLFSDVGAAASKGTDDGWENLDELVPPSTDRGGERIIAWNMHGANPTARCYGPFPMVFDRMIVGVTNEDSVARKIRVHVRYYSDGANTFLVYAAVTGSSQPPPDGVLASDLTSMTTTSAADQDKTITFDFRAAPVQRRTSGVASSTGPGDVSVQEFYVWIGWRIVAGTAGIRSMEGWEYGPSD